MTTALYWFRNDLRLYDQIALHEACKHASQLVPVYCHAASQDAFQPWGFARCSKHRTLWLQANLADLSHQLSGLGSALVTLRGNPVDVLSQLASELGATTIFCEEIAAPEEQAQIAALRQLGLMVNTIWQSSMLDPNDLPFAPKQLPDVFTTFRHQIEQANIQPRTPTDKPIQLPPLPASLQKRLPQPLDNTLCTSKADQRSSFPYHTPAFAGGETAAHQHLAKYFDQRLVQHYKMTRNQLYGMDFSSKFSPWLAIGALSAPTVMKALRTFEADHGASEGSYWLWFELLWRDYFRFLHLKYGTQLYRACGLGHKPAPVHNEENFQRWCNANTGQPLVDAGMRELAVTGYLSNRMRQIVASYLIYDLGGDWRAGAAWFESQLIDYDVYSNQGNWLYIAGLGTDPRGGRRFNPVKQAASYDPDSAYQKRWGNT